MVSAAWSKSCTDTAGSTFAGTTIAGPPLPASRCGGARRRCPGRLAGRRLNGAGAAPEETDEPYVWTSTVESGDGDDLLVVLLSSDGMVVGQALVPVRLRFGGHDGHELLSGEGARWLFREGNGGEAAAPSCARTSPETMRVVREILPSRIDAAGAATAMTRA